MASKEEIVESAEKVWNLLKVRISDEKLWRLAKAKKGPLRKWVLKELESRKKVE